jgi:hypothetical protein
MARRSSALDIPFHPDPWLNAVEGFFSAITRRQIRRGAFHSVDDLQNAIHTLHRLPQQRLSALHMDQFRQSDLRKTRSDPCIFCLSQCTRRGSRSLELGRVCAGIRLRRVAGEARWRVSVVSGLIPAHAWPLGASRRAAVRTANGSPVVRNARVGDQASPFVL